MKMPVRAWAFSLSMTRMQAGNAGAVEEVGGQADDALDEAPPDEVPADVGLLVAAEQYAVRQDDRALALALE